MTRLFTSVTLAIVAMLATTLPSASGFALFSPLLLRVNPAAGIAARVNKSSPVTADSESIISPIKASDKSTTVNKPPLASVDFSFDEDMMRYKDEVLSAVYLLYAAAVLAPFVFG